MPIATINSILLFLFSIPIVMKYRILPIDGTPYWLFGILFFLLFSDVYLSIYPVRITTAYLASLHRFLPVIVIGIVLGGVTVTAIVDRSKTAPEFGVHDIILQQEAAMRYLLEGKNPYKETYFGTPMEKWPYGELGKPAINPALYHFVMPPWYALFPFLFYGVSIPLFGFFDGRMVLLFSIVGLLVLLYRWFTHKPLAVLSMILMALSPGVIDYFIEGRSDVFALFWLVSSLVLLDAKQYVFSSVVFALAIASKQTVWFMFPFYVLALWVAHKGKLKKLALPTIAGVIVLLCLVLPFFLWDPKAFVDSVVFYLSGNSKESYPVSGYGLGMLLYEFHIIKDIHAYYPFVFWQVVVGVPVLGWFLWHFIKSPSMSRLLVGYGLSLLSIWYVSRYLNNSHLTYVGMILALGLLKNLDEGAPA